MHKIKRVILRIDYYLELIFEDNSVRVIDVAQHLKVEKARSIIGEPNLKKIPILPDSSGILWDNSTEISADSLFTNSQLIGWVDKNWGDNLQAWRPITFSTAEILVEVTDDVNAYLLLDGKMFPALKISSASFGIHENVAWYHVSFPGDDGKYDPKLEEPPIVWDTLKQLVEITNNAIDSKKDVTINITKILKRTGCKLSVNSLSPRNAAIFAKHLEKNAT